MMIFPEPVPEGQFLRATVQLLRESAGDGNINGEQIGKPWLVSSRELTIRGRSFSSRVKPAERMPPISSSASQPNSHDSRSQIQAKFVKP